jgi:hypothetical protein
MALKKSATTLRLESYIANLDLAYPAAGIIKDAHEALHRAIDGCADEETAASLIEGYFNDRPHLTKPKSKASAIPKAERDAAFGSAPSLKAQGAIVEKYGREDAEECAARYGSKLGSMKAGSDPADHEKAMSVEAARKIVSEADAAAKKEATNNPFAASYRKPDKLAQIEGIIRRKGTKFAQELARAAGTDLAGRPLRTSVR